ncbi:MarR family transcriptional regulator [Actinocrinis puniceicyclus]|uniref:MarR family transcriptional regulator n=1 Tax=Actinocrinis puniceicyclus TaxID=977794 RepID=A0A8J7WS48_9ACTN|nr:MarR family transcriptional regulator [Actinocrinis puniceicyclus]MBS2966543.1 MarR family transcriptional regulator [Actinocrinis puniceicyclus]
MADKGKTMRKTRGKPDAGPDAPASDATTSPAAAVADAAARAVVGRAVPFPAGVPGGQAARKVWGVLVSADAEMTATAITVAAGVARATASTTLNALEKAGAVLRIPGDAKSGTPDLWVLAGGVREGIGVACTPMTAESATSVDTEPSMPSAAQLCAVSGRPKRERGQLEMEVLGVLVAEYPAEFGPTALSRKLDGASSGAIANALEKLSGLGKVLRTCDAPKRYRAMDPPAVAEAQPAAA